MYRYVAAPNPSRIAPKTKALRPPINFASGRPKISPIRITVPAAQIQMPTSRDKPLIWSATRRAPLAATRTKTRSFSKNSNFGSIALRTSLGETQALQLMSLMAEKNADNKTVAETATRRGTSTSSVALTRPSLTAPCARRRLEIAGLFHQPDVSLPPYWENVVTWNLRERRGPHRLSPRYVAFSHDGMDATFLLDTGASKLESPVVVLGPGLDFIVIAANFNAFVTARLNNLLRC